MLTGVQQLRVVLASPKGSKTSIASFSTGARSKIGFDGRFLLGLGFRVQDNIGVQPRGVGVRIRESHVHSQ